jgi:hypothetical protein
MACRLTREDRFVSVDIVLRIERIGERQRRRLGMGWRQLLALIGALELGVGVFTPIMSLPMLGSANFFGNGQNVGGVVLLLLAMGSSVVLIFLEKYWACG